MNQRHAVRSAPRFAPTPLSWRLHLAFAALAAAMVGPVRANPVGGVVVGGQASIAQPSPALTQINQSSHRAVIDWRSFSIGVGESVRFNQPSASAATLNRVIGNDPSSILGSLSANGRVYLVNQNGVFIGRDAQVDAAALVLSTANVSNSDFMAGRLNFNQPGKPGARIVNEGRISAADGGLVAMVAPGVENRGVISAKLGQVILAGAPAFSLDLFGDGLVNIVLNQAGMGALTDATGKPLANYVDNSGRVVAEGGRIWISAATARGLVDGMVNISGELRATRVAQQGGEITLLGGDELNIGGSVLASSADGQGGSIGASADKIVLASNAVLDASGATGGGSVLVGGGYQGKSAVPGAIATASSLSVAQGASIKADATGSAGNGGLVVLWSENDTRFAGSVSARAGAAGGDGGLMEVSGKKYLAFEGQADAAAPKGSAGTLLLDPGSLTVADIGTGGFTASGADSTVAAGTINQVLRSGTSVALQADDNITINAQIDGRPDPGRLALFSGDLSLSAGGAVAVNAPIVLNDGAFTSNSASFTQAVDNTIATLGSKPISVTASGNIATQYLLTRGDVNLSSAAGNITAGRPLGGKLADGTLQPISNLTVSALKGNAAIANGIYTSGNATFNAGSVQVGQAIVGGELRVAAASGFQLQGDAQVSGSAVVTAGSIGMQSALRSAGNISLDSATSIELFEGAPVVSNGGDVTLRARSGHIQALDTIAANLSDPAVPVPRAGNIVLDASGDIGIRQLVALGGVDITSAAGSVNLNESLGGVDPNRPLVGSLRIKAGKDVTTNGLNLSGSSIGDGLRIEAGTAGQGGRIVVNDRIGVSSGDLSFGGGASTSATLYQGVYARNGSQSIRFDVPVIADGTRINQRWREIVPTTNPPSAVAISSELSDQLVDMIMIPVSLENDQAQRLVEAGGGLRVSFQPPSSGKAGQVLAICPVTPAGCAGAADHWMVPKIVVSNQEHMALSDTGRVEFNGGVALAQRPAAGGDVANAGLKVLVPMSAVERPARQRANPTFEQPDGSLGLFYRDFEVAISFRTQGSNAQTSPYEYLTDGDGRVNIDQLSLSLPAGNRPFGAWVSDFNVIYHNGVAQVEETTGTRQAMSDTDLASISFALYPGVLSKGDNRISVDQATTLPSGTFGFNSNSTPVGFVAPVAANAGGASLSAQILGALPSATPTAVAAVTSGASGNGASGEVVAAVSAIESRASQPTETLCPGRDRLVVGRSAGDEADVGATTAVRGAPRPVFQTTYALGEVSERLSTADGSRITGVRRADPCL